MEPAKSRDAVITWPEVQVIRVAEDDLRAERDEVARRDTFHGAVRADRHEGGRLDVAVRGRQHAAPRAAIGMRDAEPEFHARDGLQFNAQRRSDFDASFDTKDTMDKVKTNSTHVFSLVSLVSLVSSER